ncbi:hypothetical protein LCGC14_1631960 [marine sediment metagenome]|uniref:Glycosyltransferase 2-like domain-containing protein n=1 Tax=marine sediment metagenome TaxID=412755 RepID=A0A0F9IPJ4_9ZZZZ
MGKPKPTLGLAMICQNETIHIAPSIAQFFTVVDDIVVVDGGSEDDSVMWAERMGARVFHRPFDNDFSAQKNYALDQLDTDWIYLHDPDERLEPTLIEIFQYLIDVDRGQQFLEAGGIICGGNEMFDCFGIARRNFIDGVQTDIYPDYQYRLFRKNCRFERPVHELLTGWNNRTEVDFTHATLEDPARFNILHYKSGTRQEEQDVRYAKIENKYDLEALADIRKKAKEEEGDKDENA